MRASSRRAQDEDAGFARVAAAIGEPARARMLCRLLDGRTRTSTELAMAAEVSASTASIHLQKLVAGQLVTVAAQGRHRYYRLNGARVARSLESLSVIAGVQIPHDGFAPRVAEGLRMARTCYDHIAGALGVALHDRIFALGWLCLKRRSGAGEYELTDAGERPMQSLGIDVQAAREMRRRFAFACLDWSERRPHIAGSLGAAVFKMALAKRWVVEDLDSRALEVTARGRREMAARLGVLL